MSIPNRSVFKKGVIKGRIDLSASLKTKAKELSLSLNFDDQTHPYMKKEAQRPAVGGVIEDNDEPSPFIDTFAGL